MSIVSCSQTRLKHINPEDLMQHKSFSQVVKVEAGKLVFISGQVAFDKEGQVQGSDFDSQLKQSLKNVCEALNATQSDWDDIIQMKIYVVDLKPEHRFLIGMALDDIYTNGTPPASTLIGIQSLARKDLKVEIEVVAVAN